MFRENNKHYQQNMFGFKESLVDKQRKKLESSSEQKFYELIYCNIDERDFACLYSELDSCPNAPVNTMISSLMLMERKGWTYEQLFDNIHFNLLTKAALGLQTLEELPFCPATLFNFQNRLSSHYIRTGENLFERLFDRLTKSQLSALKIKTDIQRSDSFQASSNIRNYTRLQLLVEMLIRVYRVLSDEDKIKYKGKFTPYIKQSSGQYIYKLKTSSLSERLEEVGILYHLIMKELYPRYIETEIFSIFERVYLEHFALEGEKIKLRSGEDMTSDTLQSPDDVDATYRKKRGECYKGQSINIVETCNPENELNLLTDISVNKNNVDDSKVLEGRVEKLKEKTLELKELHTDGGYGSVENDKKLEELEITHVQTGVRGAESRVGIDIEKIDDSTYKVSCPNQAVASEKTSKRNKAEFDLEICIGCAYKTECNLRCGKRRKVYYFTEEDYLKKKRLKNIEQIPFERRYLRNNVEATVYEFERNMRNKKLKVRGRFRTELFAYSKGLSINFGRILRYFSSNPDKVAALCKRMSIYFCYFFKKRLTPIFRIISVLINIKTLK